MRKLNEKLESIFNNLPHVDPELREVCKMNPDLQELLSVNIEKIANQKRVSNICKKIINILITNDFKDDWITDIILNYVEGGEYIGTLPQLIEETKKEIETQKQRETEQIEHEELIKKEHQIPTKLPFSVKNFHVKDTGIFKTVKRESSNGEYEIDVMLSPTPCHICAIGSNMDTGEITYKLKIVNIMGSEIELWKKPGDLLKRAEVLKLQDYIHFQEPIAKELMNFFDESILKYRDSFPVEITTTTNGWKNDYSLFVIGNKAISANEIKEVIQISEGLQEKYISKGEKAVWIDNLNELLEYDLVRLKMYATIGAFLIRFTTVETFLIHNYFESSGAKTISMRIAASLIGNPNKDGIVQSADNSNAGLELFLETHSDTPMFWDETSDNPEFLQMVYKIGNEKGKGRGTKDLKYREGGSWKTIGQSTGEEPLTKGISVKTGQQVRVIEIHERLPKFDQEYIDQINMTLKNNYGLFLDEIIQEIFKKKDKFDQLFSAMSAQLGKPINEFAGRKKGYFVVLAIAGTILEKIFIKNGISPKNPIEICKNYFDKTVLEDPTIPYAERALQNVYQWTVRNSSRFERSIADFGSNGLKGGYELYGWITKDSIYYDEGMLSNALEDIGFNYPRAKEDWKKDVIEPYVELDKKTGKAKIKSYASPTTVNGKRIRGIRIKIQTLAEKLALEEPIFEIPKNFIDKEPNEMNLREKCQKFLYDNSKFKSVTFSDEDAAEALIREDDQIELLYGGKQYIIETMKLCRQGCRSI